MITADRILRDLESIIYKEVCATYNEKVALACVNALFDCLFLNFNKNPMYIPTSDKVSIQNRYESIWRDFTGSNHHELSIKYRLSLPQIYTIIKKMMSFNVSKVQTDIFPMPDRRTNESKPILLVVVDDYLPAEFVKCGLSQTDSIFFAKKISSHLCEKYPGISVLFSKSMKKKRCNKDQVDCFII